MTIKLNIAHDTSYRTHYDNDKSYAQTKTRATRNALHRRRRWRCAADGQKCNAGGGGGRVVAAAADTARGGGDEMEKNLRNARSVDDVKISLHSAARYRTAINKYTNVLTRRVCVCKIYALLPPLQLLYAVVAIVWGAHESETVFLNKKICRRKHTIILYCWNIVFTSDFNYIRVYLYLIVYCIIYS